MYVCTRLVYVCTCLYEVSVMYVCRRLVYVCLYEVSVCMFVGG